MNCTNLDIRGKAAGAGVKMWEIADAVGMAASNFSHKLRKELPEEEKKRIFAIIDQLSESRK